MNKNYQNLMNRIGKRVLDKRKQLGYSQRAFAQKAGVSVGIVSETETGLSLPSLKILDKIAQGLDTSLSALLDIEIEQKKDSREVLYYALLEYGMTKTDCETIIAFADFLKSKGDSK
jgi:transcriptional regulator with XRE-family HTH domain